MSGLSKWMRSEVACCEKAKKLGIQRVISDLDARTAFLRASHEIEMLEAALKKHGVEHGESSR